MTAASRSYDKRRAAKNRWRIYREAEGLGLGRSLRAFAVYAVRGVRKVRRFRHACDHNDE